MTRIIHVTEALTLFKITLDCSKSCWWNIVSDFIVISVTDK